jgi:hypothetical protein
MTRGRSRKKKCSSRKSSDENDYSQTGQGEEIATPPTARHANPRRGRPEELTEMNPNNPLQTQPEIGNNYYYAASAVSPNAHHQDKNCLCSRLTSLPNHHLMLYRYWRINILRNQRANNHFFILSYAVLAHRNTSFFCC